MRGVGREHVSFHSLTLTLTHFHVIKWRHSFCVRCTHQHHRATSVSVCSIVCCCCFFAVFCLIKFCHFVLFLIFGGGTLYKSDFNLYLENCWVCVCCVYLCVACLFQFNLNCFAFCCIVCFSCVIFKTKLARFLPSLTA